MVLLVTGVAGFIGTNFVYYYLNKYPDRKIVGIDKLTYAGDVENFMLLKPDQKSRFTFILGDITDKTFISSLFDKNDITGIINFAAESHVDRSIQGAELFIHSNVFGVFSLIETIRKKLWVQNEWPENFKFIQISTDEVYGSLTADQKFTEQTPVHPNNPYSASKASGDLFVQSFCNTYGFPGMISRCSNNYGPFQHPEKLIPLIIQRALNHQEIPVYGDGEQIRDWLYVTDHCAAIDSIYEKGLKNNVYNIGGENERTNIDLVIHILAILQEITGDRNINTTLITHVPDRLGHDRRYAIDPMKIMTQLKWRPETQFEIGMRSTILWYLHHQDWVKNRRC